MFRLITLCTLGLVLALPPAAPAAESKFKVVVIEVKGGVEVSAVTAGGLGALMGLQKGDRITGYAFEGKRKDVTKPTDLSEFLAGTPGKYRLEVSRPGEKEPVVIVGTVQFRELTTKLDPKPIRIPIFLSDKMQKK
jgi:C-terminal processing protease CtpA/Prc